MSEEVVETTAAKAKTEYTDVKMDDGRVVKFAGKRQMQRSVILNEEEGTVSVQFDLRNGKSFTISSGDLSEKVILTTIGHGISQKVGDECAGVKEVDDMALAVEEMIGRLVSGEWTATREASDSFSGASVVIRAICEVSGKSPEEVKVYLQKKIDSAAARGEKLTRNQLYRSFRSTSSPTGAVIARMEQEALEKSSKVSAKDLLAELG